MFRIIVLKLCNPKLKSRVPFYLNGAKFYLHIFMESKYSYMLCNDVSVNDGLHIRRWYDGGVQYSPGVQ